MEHKLRIVRLNLPFRVLIEFRLDEARYEHDISSELDSLAQVAPHIIGSPLLGNPLHEAWTADGEPLERLSPAEVAQACTSRYLIMPPNRGQ